jgi:hypothetical protein
LAGHRTPASGGGAEYLGGGGAARGRRLVGMGNLWVQIRWIRVGPEAVVPVH